MTSPLCGKLKARQTT